MPIEQMDPSVSDHSFWVEDEGLALVKARFTP